MTEPVSVLPVLKPSHLRSRTMKNAYEEWKAKKEQYYSRSGLMAAYYMYRGMQDGLAVRVMWIPAYKAFLVELA